MRNIGQRFVSSWLLARSLAAVVLSPQSMAIISRSSFNVSCHVFLGLSMFLLPSSGLYSMARLANLVGGSRRMCPMKRLLVATMSCNAVRPERVITLSFVMWSRHEIPRILLRQRWWNTSIILVAFAVVFHVSQLLLELRWKNIAVIWSPCWLLCTSRLAVDVGKQMKLLQIMLLRLVLPSIYSLQGLMLFIRLQQGLLTSVLPTHLVCTSSLPV